MDWMVKSGKISLVSLAGMVILLTACTSNRPEATVTAANPSPDKTTSSSTEPSPDSPGNSTPQQNFSSPQTPAANREDYRSIDLSQQTDRTSLTGSDPKAIALSAFGNRDSNTDSASVDVSYPKPDQAIVILTQTRLKDDSVRGIRYRVEFQKNPSAQANEQWQMIWAGSQFKCYPERGHQDWSPELCL
ncbi:hypothetical protein MC7420_5732 [Coleofasciculus chthonoplastes PCC 7420]|uniref:Lipoprotein n=1 Tax=Coleofasciculus chthonoplastes PCC 7420 TaxID=118168 RepID=B4VVT8_9CYAN|nr:hypothetical protein [Coleofasciculus chthonoplastes]EDX73852.1 hypothetical protein MC7420_5732 [Coleofasciculus chthonoplastes PCC 7420]